MCPKTYTFIKNRDTFVLPEWTTAGNTNDDNPQREKQN